MNEKKLRIIQIVVAILAIIIGTLLHFTYEWSGNDKIIGAFSATNESIWEHLKLAFFPMLLFGIIEYFIVRKFVNNYIEAKTIGIFSAIAFIVIFFYTYTGIIGRNFFIIDILTFVFSIIIGEIIAYKLTIRDNESTNLSKILSLGILLVLIICFIVFTYNPPKLNIFKDPTQVYNEYKKAI